MWNIFDFLYNLIVNMGVFDIGVFYVLVIFLFILIIRILILLFNIKVVKLIWGM